MATRSSSSSLPPWTIGNSAASGPKLRNRAIASGKRSSARASGSTRRRSAKEHGTEQPARRCRVSTDAGARREAIGRLYLVHCDSAPAIRPDARSRGVAGLHIVHPKLIAGDRGRFRFDSGAVHRHVARFNQARSARLAVAPRHVDDPPALPRLQELEKINVERAPNGGARDAIRHIVDFDLDPAIVDVLSPPHTARGHLDHLWSRDRADAFGARGVLLERALGQPLAREAGGQAVGSTSIRRESSPRQGDCRPGLCFGLHAFVGELSVRCCLG